MMRGAILYLHTNEAGCCGAFHWRPLPDDVARIVIAFPDIVGCGDGLFLTYPAILALRRILEAGAAAQGCDRRRRQVQPVTKGDSCMSDEAVRKPPKIELVDSPAPAEEVGERNPTSVFDDLDNLRKQSKLTVKRKTILVNVTVDKPPNNEYFRVNPDPEMMLDATVLRNAEGTSKTFYYVPPSMREHPKIKPRLRRVTIALVYTWPAGNILLWPVPVLDDRTIKSWKSARAAFDRLRTQWTQMVWNEENERLRNRDRRGRRHEKPGADLAGQNFKRTAEDRLRRQGHRQRGSSLCPPTPGSSRLRTLNIGGAI